MQSTKNALRTGSAGVEGATGERAAMLSVKDVAAMLQCSARRVCRLSGSGRMPRPVKLGALVRWPRAVVEQWIAAGCPRHGGNEGRR